MRGVDALVAKDPADLVDTLQPPHHQTLQIQLGGDTKAHLHVEGVVTGDEGAGVGPGGLGQQHRGLDFDEAPRFELTAQLGDDGDAGPRHSPRLLVDHEVEVPPPTPELDVLQPMPLLGQWAKALLEHGEPVHPDTQLALPGGHHLTGGADPVPEVDPCELIGPVLSDDGAVDEELDRSRVVTKRAELEGAERAVEHEAAGDGHSGLGAGSRLQTGEPVVEIGGEIGALKAVGIAPGGEDLLVVLSPPSSQRIGTGFGCFGHFGPVSGVTAGY